jgi:cobalt/nickel transport system permease protein
MRLIVSLVFSVVVVSLSHAPALLAALGLAVVAAAMARLDPLTTLKRMASVDGFMIFVVGFLPFTIPGESLFALWGVEASRQGLVRAIDILLASNAVVLMMLAMLGSMEQVELGSAMQGLRLPNKFVQLFLFTVRYIEVLGREYRRLRTSMKVRGFRMGFNLHSWRSLGYLFGMLIVRSIERSERIVIAMRCRGFQGQFHTLATPRAPGLLDRAFVVLSSAVCVALVALEHV